MILPAIRTSLCARVPANPFRALSTAPSTSSPTPSTSALPSDEPQPVLLPYSIPRTPSGFLPVYMDVKSSGQRLTTIVRKIDGDVEVSLTG